MDHEDPSALQNPEVVLDALRDLKICDPACGSGAYLLGMMQELLRLRESLFRATAKDHKDIYNRKLEIIQNNLYGVDLDPFAVNIAMLRFYGLDAQTHQPVDSKRFDDYLAGKRQAYVMVAGKQQFFPKRTLATIEYSIEATYQGLYQRLRGYLGRPKRHTL